MLWSRADIGARAGGAQCHARPRFADGLAWTCRKFDRRRADMLPPRKALHAPNVIRSTG